MILNEIKKALYKEKPLANRYQGTIDQAYYRSRLNNGETIWFKVPIADMGDTAYFKPVMPAQLLIRYIVT
jgi:hypothetical protein